jgi:hypothetical protein
MMSAVVTVATPLSITFPPAVFTNILKLFVVEQFLWLKFWYK